VRLLDLLLPDYCGMRDLHLDLRDDSDSPGAVAVLIGRNGAGKSRILHALAEIFAALYRWNAKKPLDFDFHVVYELGVDAIEVHGAASKPPVVLRSTGGSAGERIRRADWPNVLPSWMFGYQAVRSSRWDPVFTGDAPRLKAALTRAHPWPLDTPIEFRPQRHLLCGADQLPLVVLALATQWSERFGIHLRDQCGIEGFESAELTVNGAPFRARATRSWRLSGAVEALFQRLYDSGHFGLIPDLGLSGQDLTEFRIDISTPEDLTALRAMFGTDLDMFLLLDTLRGVGALTADVRLRTTSGSLVRPSELSAGQQQALTILGMLRLQRGSESLFLIDEPDAHFHPEWSQQWYADVTSMLEDGQRSQLVATTHDPVLVANVPSSKIRIVRQHTNGSITTAPPGFDVRGYGVGPLLTSDLYGLATQLDTATQDLIDRQYELTRTLELDEQEQQELDKITNTLRERGFNTTHRDPAVQLFLAELNWRRRRLRQAHGETEAVLTVELAQMVSQLYDDRLTQGL